MQRYTFFHCDSQKSVNRFPDRWKRWYRINFAMLPLWLMGLIVADSRLRALPVRHGGSAAVHLLPVLRSRRFQSSEERKSYIQIEKNISLRFNFERVALFENKHVIDL
jgi:hypothetical protein